jgi:serine/threonine protein phosphatase PrpC
LVDAGLISARDAEHHPERNVITRAIGADEFVDPYFWMLPVDAHDAFLLCSDGLTKELDAHDINRILAARMATPELRGTIADALVEAALARGASDNVSVIFIDSFSTAPTDIPPSG